jgi:antitoxin CptB
LRAGTLQLHAFYQVLTLPQSRTISAPPGTSGLLALRATRTKLDLTMTGLNRSSDGLDVRRKKLLFRCWHRGTREMDLIMGRFAENSIAELSDDELDQLELLIDLPDPDLYAAMSGAGDIPANLKGSVYERMRAFKVSDFEA